MVARGPTGPVERLHVVPKFTTTYNAIKAEVESIKPFGLLIIFNIKVSYYENGRLEEILPVSSYKHTEIKLHYCCYLIVMRKYEFDKKLSFMRLDMMTNL